MKIKECHNEGHTETSQRAGTPEGKKYGRNVNSETS